MTSMLRESQNQSKDRGEKSDMTVDPFWFGVLMTLVAEIGFVIIGAIINTIHHRNDPEEEDGDVMMSEEEFRAMIREAVRDAADNVIREKFDGEEK